MTSRERIRHVIQHKEPDKVPVDFGGRSSAIEEEEYDLIKEYL